MSAAGTTARAGYELPPRPPLPRPIGAFMFWRRTVPFMDWCRHRCGPSFTVWAPPFGDVVLLTDREHVREMFAADPAFIHPGEAYATVLRNVMGSRSVFLLDEDEHLDMRRLMLPPFHGGRVQRYAELVADIAAREVDSWQVGATMRLDEAMERIALEVMLRAVFGVDDRERRDRLRAQLPHVAGPAALLQLSWIAPSLERVGPWRRHRELVGSTDALIAEEIASRRGAGDLEERGDVLSMLVAARYEDGSGLSERELLDQVMTLLVAGHETTATAMTWAFERLVRHPEALARATEPGEERSRYLDAVVKETLRSRPAVLNVIRKIARDGELAGYRLPAGTFVVVPLSAVHRAQAHHPPDPLAFRPERFLDGSSPPYSWIPFGGGRRRCLGAPLATLEMKVVLATVLDRVELAPSRPEDEALEVKHVTLVPSRGGEVVVTGRRAPVGAPPERVLAYGAAAA